MHWPLGGAVVGNGDGRSYAGCTHTETEELRGTFTPTVW